MTPLKAIRAKCLDCCCSSSAEVRRCPSQGCSLWQYRDGHNPARAGLGGRGFPSKTPNSRPDFEEGEDAEDGRE